MRQFKIVVEKHPDTYLAYPLGLKGVIVGQGDSYEAALADVKSAIQVHIETFGSEAAEMNAVQIRRKDYQWRWNFLPFRPWFSILHGQVARDLLSNWLSLGRAISLSSFRRKPESRLLLAAFWIPACAGMTDQQLSEKLIWTRLV
jgi:predicted RNase H-like HicB family nuclease